MLMTAVQPINEKETVKATTQGLSLQPEPEKLLYGYEPRKTLRQEVRYSFHMAGNTGGIKKIRFLFKCIYLSSTEHLQYGKVDVRHKHYKNTTYDSHHRDFYIQAYAGHQLHSRNRKHIDTALSCSF